jgi:Flp pilus assembly protein TadD
VPKVMEHFQQFSLAARQNREGDALAEAQRMTQLAPDWDVPWRQLGLICLRLGQAEESFAAYRRAEELAELDAGSYNNLGVGFLKHHQPADATRCFQAALRQQPELDTARRNLDGIMRSGAEDGK